MHHQRRRPAPQTRSVKWRLCFAVDSKPDVISKRPKANIEIDRQALEKPAVWRHCGRIRNYTLPPYPTLPYPLSTSAQRLTVKFYRRWSSGVRYNQARVSSAGTNADINMEAERRGVVIAKQEDRPLGTVTLTR